MVPTHLLYFAPHRHDNSHLLHFHSTDAVFFSSLLPVPGKSRPPSPFQPFPYLSIHNPRRSLPMNIFDRSFVAFIPLSTINIAIHLQSASTLLHFLLVMTIYISLAIILLIPLQSRYLWLRIPPVILLFSLLYLDLHHNGRILGG